MFFFLKFLIYVWKLKGEKKGIQSLKQRINYQNEAKEKEIFLLLFSHTQIYYTKEKDYQTPFLNAFTMCEFVSVSVTVNLEVNIKKKKTYIFLKRKSSNSLIYFIGEKFVECESFTLFFYIFFVLHYLISLWQLRQF